MGNWNEAYNVNWELVIVYIGNKVVNWMRSYNWF